ncbi:hypothetical protein DEI98_06545 [Curtobacterium sp. MCLR17_034]|nr:hypothetical protein DEI98_06545 [Curtobacterium sp. MCLR17_034]
MLTPEQYRALAAEAKQFAVAHRCAGEWITADRHDRFEAALRAAADQLEAGGFDDGYRNGYKVGYMHASGKADAS